MIKGIIFDMDGVLVDSEKLYQRFWIEACREFGFELTQEMALSLRSNSAETAAPKFKKWFGESADYKQLRDCRARLMSEHTERFGVDLKPGAAEALDKLKSMGLKAALATSSPVQRAFRYLSPYGLFDCFDAVVSGRNVAKSKPAPDIYISAAEQLGLSCSECIAVEDSPSGILSAKAADCFTVMIPDLTQPDNELLPMIDMKIDCLLDLIPLLNELNGSC